MVGSCIYENAVIVPGSALDSGIFLNGAKDVETPVANRDDVLAEESNVTHVAAPDDIFDAGGFYSGQ